MAWDFSTEPEFQEKLDWVDQFCKEKVEPLDYVFPYAVRSPDPVVKAYVRELQQEVKDQGLWAIFLDEELGGPGFGQLPRPDSLSRVGLQLVAGMTVGRGGKLTFRNRDPGAEVEACLPLRT